MSAGNAVTTALNNMTNNDAVTEVGARGCHEHGHWVFACVEIGDGGPVQDMMEDLGFLAHVDPTAPDDVLEDYDDEDRLRGADEMMLSFEYGATY
jgi:hypothetical protein